MFIQVSLGFLSTGNAAALPSTKCTAYSRGIAGNVGCDVRADTTGNSQAKASLYPQTSPMSHRGRPPACRGGVSRSSCDGFRWDRRDPEAKRGIPVGRSRASGAVCMFQLDCHCQVFGFAPPSSVFTLFGQRVPHVGSYCNLGAEFSALSPHSPRVGAYHHGAGLPRCFIPVR